MARAPGGSWAHTLAPISPLLSSLESPGEEAVTTGIMAAQDLSLCGKKGDLGGGD